MEIVQAAVSFTLQQRLRAFCRNTATGSLVGTADKCLHALEPQQGLLLELGCLSKTMPQKTMLQYSHPCECVGEAELLESRARALHHPLALRLHTWEPHRASLRRRFLAPRMFPWQRSQHRCFRPAGACRPCSAQRFHSIMKYSLDYNITWVSVTVWIVYHSVPSGNEARTS